jgi:hypothetical protein
MRAIAEQKPNKPDAGIAFLFHARRHRHEVADTER